MQLWSVCRCLLLGGHGAPCAVSILSVNCFGWFTGSLIGLLGTAMLAYDQALPRLLEPAVVVFALTARAVGLDLPFAVWMVLVPLTRLVALVPVSVADFGLIQAAHVSVLALFGVPPWQSFALSALFAVEGLLIHSTLGACAFLMGGRSERTSGAFSRRASFSLDGP